MRRPLPLLVLLFVTTAAPSSRGAEGGTWVDLDLPRGFHVDLCEAIVRDRPPAGSPSLTLSAAGLTATAPMRRLAPLQGGGGARPRIGREDGEGVTEAPALLGTELVFDLGPGRWSYARVLEADRDRVRLEYLLVDRPDLDRVTREPLVVQARPMGGEIALSWRDEAPGDTTYSLDRRRLPRLFEEDPVPWRELCRTRGKAWRDADVEPSRLYEYRVARIGRGVRFGARVRAVAELHDPEQPIRLATGARLDLVTGREGGEREDLRVEYVGPNGIQVAPGPGVQLRSLGPSEERSWIIPALGDRGWTNQRMFLPGGRSLLVHLAEGVYGRLRASTAGGSEALLLVELDLGGGRLFPPPPPAPAARWSPRHGIVLDVRPAPTGPPGLEAGPLTWVVEEERDLDSGSWEEVATSALDRGQGLAVLGEHPLGPTRLRLRIRLPGGRLSPPSDSITVLVGDDGGTGATRLLDAAIADLAHPEYLRRRRAQEILRALGERAVPRLLDALSAEDPEIVAAARELLAGHKNDSARSGAPDLELAPALLGARARALGLGDAPPGLLEAEADRRALAVLRHLSGALSEGREGWRALVAAADPDPGVRLLAVLAPALASPPPPPAPISAALEERALELAAGGSQPRPPLPLEAHRSPTEAALELLGVLDPTRPRRALARLTAIADLLEQHQGFHAEQTALARAGLVDGLLALHDDTGETVFLDAALRAVGDPSSRLVAVQALADHRLARRSGSPGERAEVRVERLPEPSLQALDEWLSEREKDDVEPLDLVLPAGVYEHDEGASPSLTVRGRGLRLIAEGEVVLRTGLTLVDGADCVLEGLRIAPQSGVAITCLRSSVLLRDCVLVPASQGLQGTDAIVELASTQIVRGSAHTRAAGGMRFSGASMLLARDVLVDAGGAAVAGARLAYIERSVLDGGSQIGLDSPIGGELWLVDSLVRGEVAGLTSSGAGLLEGVVTIGGAKGALRASGDLRVCPDHVRLLGAGEGEDRPSSLERCPLGR